jgi:hypothetical protein
MPHIDRRGFLTASLATVGAAMVRGAATGGRIDVHHHFAPPAWIGEVRSRPLLHADLQAIERENAVRLFPRFGA